MSKYTSIQKYKIGQNIKQIRKANGLDYHNFGKVIGLSGDTVKKIESGHYLHDLDGHIERIVKTCQHPMITFNRIINGDMSFLAKNDLYFGKTKLSEILDDEFVYDDAELEITLMFPFLKDEQSLKSKSFVAAYEMCIKKGFCENINCKQVNQLINLFECALQEGATSCASTNILSCIGCALLAIPVDSRYGVLNTINRNKTIASLIELGDVIIGSFNNKKYIKAKRDILSKYEPTIEKHLNQVINDKEYSDYGYYFLFMRYNHWLFIEEKPNIDYFQNQLFFSHMFKTLVKLGNKYAIAYNDFLENQKVLY